MSQLLTPDLAAWQPTPSLPFFQGVNAHIIGTALVEGQTGDFTS
jgi:hypothetical protein